MSPVDPYQALRALEGKGLQEDPVHGAENRGRSTDAHGNGQQGDHREQRLSSHGSKGEDKILPGPVLVFIRHASIIDTAIPVTFLSNAHGLRLRYVFKRELLVDPCIDVAGHASPNYFIDRAGTAKAELGGIRKLAEDLGEEGVLLYPEGTRFTERKKRIALTRLARSHPELLAEAESYQYCLPPKPGGALTLLDAAPDTDVLIIAHRGLEGLAEVADLLSGSVVGKTVEVQIWRIPAEEVPEGDGRRRWLFDWWKRVDDFVGA